VFHVRCLLHCLVLRAASAGQKGKVLPLHLRQTFELARHDVRKIQPQTVARIHASTPRRP